MKFKVDQGLQQKYLRSEDLTPCKNSCLLCGSEKRGKVFSLQSDPKIDLLECYDCNIVSASRIPTTDALGRAYETFYSDSRYGEKDQRVALGAPYKLAKHIFNNLTDELKSKSEIDILDFGGGDGTVSIELAKMLKNNVINRVNVIVVDYEAYNRSINGYIEVQGKKKLSDLDQDKKYDIVLASAVMEHVPDPKADFDLLLSSLKSGGIYYARTPYFVPFMKLFSFFGVKCEFIYPIHLHDMGPDFWNNLLDNLGLDRNIYKMISSKPSIVESSFSDQFFFTVFSYLAKAPWYLLSLFSLQKMYPLVGGWEVVIRKT